MEDSKRKKLFCLLLQYIISIALQFEMVTVAYGHILRPEMLMYDQEKGITVFLKIKVG